MFFNLDITQENNSSFIYPNYYDEFKNSIAEVRYDPDLPKIYIINIWEDPKAVKKTNTFSHLNHEKRIEKWIRLYQMFEKSFKEKSDLFSDISFDRISFDFRISLNHFLSLSPNVISVGVSNDESVFIYSEFGNISVFFDLFFSEENKTDALLNIIEEQKPICSYSNTIEKTLSKVNEFIKVPEYDLSEPFIAG